jgi:hypothetical protein
LNNAQLAKRIKNLAEKLKPVPSEGIRIDFYSLTEPEQYVILKNSELYQTYGDNIPREVFVKNKEVLFKLNDIALNRAMELFQFVFPRALMLDEVQQELFRLNFNLFLLKFCDSLDNARKWSQAKREQFLSEINCEAKKPKECEEEAVVDGEESNH